MHYYTIITYTIHITMLYYNLNIYAIKVEHIFFYIVDGYYTYFGLEALLTEDGPGLFCIQN